VTVRPAVPLSARLADPVPVGLAGFGLTTFMLSMIEVGAISKAALPVVLASALAYGGLLQLLAGMWAFVRHNTFAAVALGSYGAFWISYWALNTFYLSKIPAAEQNSALGLFLISWAVFSFYMWMVSLRVNLGVMPTLQQRPAGERVRASAGDAPHRATCKAQGLADGADVGGAVRDMTAGLRRGPAVPRPVVGDQRQVPGGRVLDPALVQQPGVGRTHLHEHHTTAVAGDLYAQPTSVGRLHLPGLR